jgi:hypothetical protein
MQLGFRVLGIVAQNRLAAFSRIAADAAAAPDLPHRVDLSHAAANTLVGLDRVTDRIRDLGGDPITEMSAFSGLLGVFDARTEPATFWERLVKGYVGYGVSDDFCRELASLIDPETDELVREVLGSTDYTDIVLQSLSTVITADPKLASRLALWGRRLIGEALRVVQEVLLVNPDLDEVLRATSDGAETGFAHVLPRLTSEHARRMSRLGLAA